ncbi:MAG: polymer-forming cytoskeletal protein [Chromatiales bacterium]|jgi:cytoskeletal protein CcmA (bactofilin family)|nr:polymer-forming cytoskeletal protein [Chromatiales bacterium]
MFKKSEPEPYQNGHTNGSNGSNGSIAAAAIMADREQQTRVHATIGATIRIKGDISGEENLTIEGTVEGTVTVKEHSLQIGKNGRLNADVFAKIIRIEGHVEGNMHAEEQVVIRSSGVVRGNIVSPRLTMEDGCSFKGSVDMDSSRKSEVRRLPAEAASQAKNADGSTPLAS